MVRPPSPHEEDARRLACERGTSVTERVRYVNRIKGGSCSGTHRCAEKSPGSVLSGIQLVLSARAQKRLIGMCAEPGP